MAQSTAGITLKRCTETTAGTFPTTSYVEIGEITNLPEYGGAPSGLDCTPLNETVAHRYVPGLMDGGDSWGIEMNMTASGVTSWNDFCASAASSFASNKKTWFEVAIPGWSNSFYVAGLPAKINWPGSGVDEVFNGTAYITINEVKGWATKSN